MLHPDEGCKLIASQLRLAPETRQEEFRRK
jgi:hypothetical protein